MTHLDKRPVYKDKTIEKAFKNALFYYVKYTGDCPICLDFFEQPQVLPCGHCYCHSCIVKCIEHSSFCPMCAEYFWIFKPAHFFFTQEIGDSILLRKCISTDVFSSDFYDYPYLLEYFEDTAVVVDNKIVKNEFYQSNDGQLYFLDPNMTKNMNSKPEYLYSKIRSKYECLADWRRFPELSHIPSGTKIVIIKI